MPTESSPLGDGAKIDLTEAPNATVQKPFPEQSRPKTELTHQFFDPHDAGCIKAAANGNVLTDCGSSPQKEAASKKGGAVLLGDLGATKEGAKIGSVHKPLSLGDSDEENVEDDGEEDVSSEEESVEEEEEEEYDEEDEEDEEQGGSEEDKDGHDDELGEPPAKRKK